ncbi:MAG: S8 family serine peptidase [Lachnospiraceae bacterium]|nr:S8 family serine peptidase [Lachnospiraceae bacterium]
MKKEKLVRMAAVVMAANLVIFQIQPGAAGAQLKKERKHPEQVEGIRTIEKDISVVPVTSGAVSVEGELQETSVDRKHILYNKKGKIRYIVKADSKSAYRKAEVFCEGKEKSDTEDYAVLQEEHLLVTSLSTRDVGQLEKIEGVSVEVDALVDGAVEKAASGAVVDFSQDSQNEEELKEALDTVARSEWNLHAIRMDGTKTGNDTIKVAVLDSGRDIYGDYEVKGSVDLVDGEDNIYGTDLTGHGTAVQSVIGAKENELANTGVTSSDTAVEMYSVRVLDENNQAPVSRVAEGIQWCIDNGMDVVNMSFGTDYYSETLEDLVVKAEQAGLLLVAAAGNNGAEQENGVQYPARYQQVIGVGSVNEKMERSEFSAVGDGVELMAPGENIPVSSSFQCQAVGRGTSLAAPHVAAMAAMLWSQDADRSNREIRGILQRSARYLGETQEYGFGLVDYTHALEVMEKFDLVQWDKDIAANPAEVNDSTVKEYVLPEIVRASWNKDMHKALIDSFPSTLDKEIVLRYSVIADDDYKIKDNQNNAILHAGLDSNYVAGARMLYNIAFDLVLSVGKNKITLPKNDEEMEDYLDGLGVNYELYRRAPGVNWEQFKQVQNIILNDIRKQSTSKKQASGLLGLAFHILGDAYAHQVIIPTYYSVAYAVTEGGYSMGQLFDNPDRVKERIASGDMTTRQLKNCAVSDDKKDIIRRLTEDNTNFLPYRYSLAAAWACSRIMDLWEAKKYFDMYVYCPHITSSGCEQYRLRSLADHVCASYGNLTNGNYLNPKLVLEEEEWYKLSGMK